MDRKYNEEGDIVQCVKNVNEQLQYTVNCTLLRVCAKSYHGKEAGILGLPLWSSG